MNMVSASQRAAKFAKELSFDSDIERVMKAVKLWRASIDASEKKSVATLDRIVFRLVVAFVVTTILVPLGSRWMAHAAWNERARGVVLVVMYVVAGATTIWLLVLANARNLKKDFDELNLPAFSVIDDVDVSNARIRELEMKLIDVSTDALRITRDRFSEYSTDYEKSVLVTFGSSSFVGLAGGAIALFTSKQAMDWFFTPATISATDVVVRSVSIALAILVCTGWFLWARARARIAELAVCRTALSYIVSKRVGQNAHSDQHLSRRDAHGAAM